MYVKSSGIGLAIFFAVSSAFCTKGSIILHKLHLLKYVKIEEGKILKHYSSHPMKVHGLINTLVEMNCRFTVEDNSFTRMNHGNRPL